LAGRVDCIAEWNRVPSVVDFKGSTKAKQKEEIDNYFAQSAAYSIMWQELTGEILPQIVVIICCEDGTKRIFVERTKNWIPVLFDFCSDFKKISISSAQR
jgi:genome maintenance exonuclease 1